MPETGYTKRRARWSREDCIKAVQDWVKRYGDIPAATDWQPSDCASAAARSARRAQRWTERGMRFHDGEYPWAGSVSKLFGTWNGLITAAGFEPRLRPKPLDDSLDTTVDDARLVSLAERVQREKGDRRRAALYELSSAAMTMALDEGVTELEAEAA